MKSNSVNRIWYWFCILFLLTGFLAFLFRGIGHGVSRREPNDYWATYTVPRAWTQGRTLYNTETLSDIWRVNATTPATSYTRYAIQTQFVMPPAIPFLIPLSALPWQIANAAWIVISGICYLVMIWSIRPREADRLAILFFLGLCLWLDPVRIGLANGNVTPLLVALLGLSFVAWRSGRHALCGILLGIVGCFKPQFALPAGLFMLVRAEWTPIAYAAGTCISALTVFLLRLRVAGVSWWHDFLLRSEAFGRPGGPNDSSLLSPHRYNLINLQVPLSGAIKDATVVNVVSVAIFCILLVLWFVARRRASEQAMLSFATINILFLLPAYHRTYDATVVVFALSWVLADRDATLRVRLWVIGLCLVFLQPLPTLIIARTSDWPAISAGSDSLLLRTVVFPHETWFLLALSIVLTVCLVKRYEFVPRFSTQKAAPDSAALSS